LLVPVLFAFQSLVAGETCPAPVDVEARVRTILHLTPEQVLNEGFVVERHEAGLYVELRSADSTLIGQRTLPLEGNCDELAQAAAVVLSAWLSDVHPDFAGALPAPIPTPTPAPATEPAPPLPLPPQPPASPKRAVTPPPQTPSPPPRRWELSVGLGGDITSGGLALAGMLGVGYLPSRQGFGVTATAIVSLPHQEPLGPGFVDWRRWPLGVGPSLRAGTGSVGWDFSLGPSLAWLHVAGSSFDRPSSNDDVAAGGFINLRISSRGRKGGVFGLAAAQFYPADKVAHATQGTEEWFAPLPGWAINLLIGGWLAP
jgi:hypothetical protein